MKKTFAAFAAAVMALGAAMTFTACSKDKVAEHDHVWNDGEVTTEATCIKEGIKTYSCTVEGCTQKKTVPIATIAHSWNDGVVTKEATCSEEGVKTYTCTVEGCGKTKEEATEKAAHRYNDGVITEAPDFLKKGKNKVTCLECEEEKIEAVEARADYSEQFYTTLTEQNNWSYGYANSYDAQTGEVDFVRIEQTEGNTWKSGNTEIGKGYVSTENIAVIAYTFNYAIPELVQTGVSVSFAGEENAAPLKAYLIHTDKNGVLYEAVELNEDDENNWSYKTEQALDIAQGDIFYLVLENDGDAKAGGNLAFTFTAPCIHVWDNGTVTKASTCTETGVIEYKCISCDKKITDSVDLIPHEYDEGKITKEPTEDEYGERTYTCEVCGDTKTERVSPTKFNGANFFEDFSTDGGNGWLYGYASNYDWDTNKFTFNPLKKVNDEAWGGTPGLEIKKDWILVEGDAAVGFKVPVLQTKVTVEVDFVGTTPAETRICARVVVMGADGNAKAVEIVDDGKNSASWNVNYEFDVAENDIIYVVLFRQTDAWAQGKLQVVINEKTSEQPTPETYAITFAGGDDATGTAPTIANKAEGAKFYLPANTFNKNGHTFAGWNDGTSTYQPITDEYTMPAHAVTFTAQWTENSVTPPTEKEVANFTEDFSLDNQDGAWSYGKMEDPWDNTRHFVQSTTKTTDAWTADGVEIKAGWINAASTATIAYTAEKAGSAKLKVEFTGSGADTLLAIRIYTVNTEDVLTEAAFNAAKNGEGKQVAEITRTFAAGETVYVMFSNEKWDDSSEAVVPNGTLDIIVTADEQQTPAPVFGGASLKDDFSLASNPNGAWSYGYVNYHFGENENFDFVAATTKGEFGWTALVEEDGDTKVNVDIRDDFLIANKGFATIAYKFTDAAKVNVYFKFTGNGLSDGQQGTFNIRIGVKHSDGTLVSAPSFRDGVEVTVNEVMEFEEGDTIYFIIEHGATGYDSGTPVITITQANSDV